MLTAMLHFQLKEIPEDFFVDIVSKNNFLTVVLQVWCIISVYIHVALLKQATFFTMLSKDGDTVSKACMFRNSNSVNSSKIQFLVKTD